MNAADFIKIELEAYIRSQNLNSYELVPLIMKAFEAYDEYKRLVYLKGRPFKNMNYE